MSHRWFVRSFVRSSPIARRPIEFPFPFPTTSPSSVHFCRGDTRNETRVANLSFSWFLLFLSPQLNLSSNRLENRLDTATEWKEHFPRFLPFRSDSLARIVSFVRMANLFTEKQRKAFRNDPRKEFPLVIVIRY